MPEGTSGGTAYVGVAPDFSGFSSKLSQGVSQAARDAGSQLSAGIKTGTDAATGHISRLGSVMHSLAGEAGPLGGVFTDLGNKIGAGFEHGATAAESARERIGGALTAIGISAAALGFGLEQISKPLETATAQLETVIKNTGKSFDDYAPQIDKAGKSAERYGFTTADTREALAKLTTANQDTGKSLGELNAIEEIAKAQHSSLAEAANKVVAAYGGRARGLKQFLPDLQLSAVTEKQVEEAQKKHQSTVEALGGAEQKLADFEERTSARRAAAVEAATAKIEAAEERAANAREHYSELVQNVAEADAQAEADYADKKVAAADKVREADEHLAQLKEQFAEQEGVAAQQQTDRIQQASDSEAQAARDYADQVVQADQRVTDSGQKVVDLKRQYAEQEADARQQQAEREAASIQKVTDAESTEADAEQHVRDLRKQFADEAVQAQEKYADAAEQAAERVAATEQSLADTEISLADAVAAARQRAEDVRESGAQRTADAEQHLADLQARNAVAGDPKRAAEVARQQEYRNAQEAINRAQADQRKADAQAADAVTKAEKAQQDGRVKAEDAVTKAKKEQLKVIEAGDGLAAKQPAHARELEKATKAVAVAERGVTSAKAEQIKVAANATKLAEEEAKHVRDIDKAERESNDAQLARQKLVEVGSKRLADQKIKDAKAIADGDRQIQDQRERDARELQSADDALGKAEEEQRKVLGRDREKLNTQERKEQDQITKAAQETQKAEEAVNKARAEGAKAGQLTVSERQEERKLQDDILKKRKDEEDSAKKLADLTAAQHDNIAKVDEALGKIHERLKGSLEAQRNTFSGHLKEIETKVEDFLARIGAKLAKPLLSAGLPLAVAGSVFRRGRRAAAGTSGAASGAAEAGAEAGAGAAAAGTEGLVAGGAAEGAVLGGEAAGAGAAGLGAEAASGGVFGPVGLGITASIAGLVLLYEKWKPFHDAVNKGLSEIKDHWRGVSQAAAFAMGGPVLALIVKEIEDHWKEIVKGAKSMWHDIEDGAKQGWADIKKIWAEWEPTIKPIWEDLKQGAKTAWTEISTAVKTAWETVIKPAWTEIGHIIRDVLTPMWDVFAAAVKVAWTTIKTEIKIAWGIIKVDLEAMHAYYEDVLKPVFAVLWEAAKIAWAGIKDAVKAAWTLEIHPALIAMHAYYEDVLKPVFTTLWHDVVEPAWKGISTAVKTAWETIIKPALGELKTFFDNDLVPAFHTIETVATTVWDNISKAFKAGIKVIGDVLGGIFHAAAWVADKVGADNLHSALNDAGDKLSGLGDSGGGGTTTTNNGTIQSSSGRLSGGTRSFTSDANASRGELAAGGRTGFSTNEPTYLVGEGNPNYEEYVLATDPQYRGRNVGLWKQAGEKLGMFASGGVLGGIGDWISDAASTVKGAIGDIANLFKQGAAYALEHVWPKLPVPGNLLGLVPGVGNGLRDKVIDFIKGKEKDQAAAASGASGASADLGGATTSTGVPDDQVALAKQYGGQYEVDPTLLLAIAAQETDFGRLGLGRSGYTLGVGAFDTGAGPASTYAGIDNQYRIGAQTLHRMGVHNLDDVLAGKAKDWATDPAWEAGVASHYRGLKGQGYRAGGVVGELLNRLTVHSQSFDRGGVLQPGDNLVRNDTGGPESLSPGGINYDQLAAAVAREVAPIIDALEGMSVQVDGRRFGQLTARNLERYRVSRS